MRPYKYIRLWELMLTASVAEQRIRLLKIDSDTMLFPDRLLATLQTAAATVAGEHAQDAPFTSMPY